jgi:hypothetical protein
MLRTGSTLMTKVIIAALLAGALMAPGTAAAQHEANTGQARVPWVTVGIGAGTPFGEGGAAGIITIQVPLARFLVAESETEMREPESWVGRRVISTAINVLLRAGRGPVAGFVGGGPGVHFTELNPRPQASAQLADPLPAATWSLGAGMLVPVNREVPVPPWSPQGYASIYMPFYSALPLLVGSVRVPLGRSIFVEGEIGRAAAGGARRWTDGHNLRPWPQPYGYRAQLLTDASQSRSAVTALASIGYRLGTSNVSHYIAGGVGLRRTAGKFDVLTRCEPLEPDGCLGTSTFEFHAESTGLAPTAQLQWGVDVKATRRLSIYGSGRWAAMGETTYDDTKHGGFTITSGARMAIGAGDVVPRQRDDRPHYIRTASLMGAVIGTFAGAIIGRGSNHDDVRLAAPAGMTVWGFGIGAAIGAIGRATAGR